MKKIKIAVSLIAASIGAFTANAISLDDIQFWTGSGTNRAALIIEWSSPEVFNSTTVPAPVTTKALVWGYKFNGTVTAQDMALAILAADPKLYAIGDISEYGLALDAIGYNLNGDGVTGVVDGGVTNFFKGFLKGSTVDADSARPINSGDLYWGGHYGPSWESWHELGGKGAFNSSPNRGTGKYWTPYNSTNVWDGGVHGEWELAWGLTYTTITNGSWVGISVAGGGDNWMDESDPGTIAYEYHKHAPVAPEGIATAYVYNATDFATEVVSSSSLSTTPYDDPSAVLGRPTLKFANAFGDTSAHRSKIIEPPYNKAPDGSKVITQINAGGQITVKMGRKIYDDPNNPYGVDLIVYGNSFFTPTGAGAMISDTSDLNVAKFGTSGSFYGHPAKVSISQDGITWYSFTNTGSLYPDNAYRWDEYSHAWTDEQLNPTKPLNPSVYSMNLSTQPIANGLDQFMGAAGGSGFDLKESGFDWIQYVRVEPSSTYTVIDAIAAVNPAVLGDDLSITPDNIVSGRTNLVFQNPADLSQTLVSLNFKAVNDVAKISASPLNEISSYAPITGTISSGYKISAGSVTGANAITLTNDLALRVASGYLGDGADLVLLQWNGTNWDQPNFTYNVTNHMVQVDNVTNLSAFVISQLSVKPQIQISPDGLHLGFSPFKGKQYTVERSVDLVHWTTVASMTAANEDDIVVKDPEPLTSAAFYRVRFGH